MMRGMSRLAMGAALAVSLSLALIIAILLLLLADLFFALRRRRHQTADSPTPAASTAEDPQSASFPLRRYRFPFYAHGVLQAPTSLLLSAPKLLSAAAAPPRHVPKHVRCVTTSPVEAKNVLVSAPSPPCPYRLSSDSDHYIYISNPIFDGGACRVTGDSGCCTTPYETPETSPSHLGMEEEEGGSHFGMEEEEGGGADSEYSPPLTLMKKLPPILPGTVAAAGTLDGRGSLATSASATETNRASFSSSCTPSSSPSYGD